MTEPAPRIAVITFPGSNDDGDARLALERLTETPFERYLADPEVVLCN